jgi:hypothetical protein
MSAKKSFSKAAFGTGAAVFLAAGLVGGLSSLVNVDLSVSFNQTADLVSGLGMAAGAGIGAVAGLGIGKFIDSRSNAGMLKGITRVFGAIALGAVLGGVAGNYGADKLFDESQKVDISITPASKKVETAPAPAPEPAPAPVPQN